MNVELVAIGPRDVVLTQLEIPLEVVLTLPSATPAYLAVNAAPAQELPTDFVRRVDLFVVNTTEYALIPQLREARLVAVTQRLARSRAARARPPRRRGARARRATGQHRRSRRRVLCRAHPGPRRRCRPGGCVERGLRCRRCGSHRPLGTACARAAALLPDALRRTRIRKKQAAAPHGVTGITDDKCQNPSNLTTRLFRIVRTAC